MRDEGVETVGGDDSETGTMTKKKEEKNRRQISVPASSRTSGIKWRATTTVYDCIHCFICNRANNIDITLPFFSNLQLYNVVMTSLLQLCLSVVEMKIH